jgi:hypothetical protein
MPRTAKSLMGATLAATDGDIGSVRDLYFDDGSWTIRYLAIDTGTWLPGRQVLISPMSVTGADETSVSVSLSREQVEGSPSVDTDKPVSRQYEEDYSRYYGYPYYWSGPFRWGPVAIPGEMVLAAVPVGELVPDGSGGNPRLRSAREVIGYYIEAVDGDIGHVDDFLVDDREWAVRYMIAATRNWWPGKRVLVSPAWISEVSWPDSRVYVDLTRDGVKAAPEYDPDRPLEREYEHRLYKHYGRPNYWE